MSDGVPPIRLTLATVSIVGILLVTVAHLSHAQRPSAAPAGEPAESYLPVVIGQSFEAILKDDAAQKDTFMQRRAPCWKNGTTSATDRRASRCPRAGSRCSRAPASGCRPG
jgi:hypothetical protein